MERKLLLPMIQKLTLTLSSDMGVLIFTVLINLRLIRFLLNVFISTFSINEGRNNVHFQFFLCLLIKRSTLYM